MTASQPPPTVHTAITEARAHERQQCIAFLRREAARRDAASIEMDGPQAELFAEDSASFATAAGLLSVWASVATANAVAVGPGAEDTQVEVAIRADERRRCAVLLRDHAAQMRQQRELIAAGTASFLANLIDPMGPVMGAPATGGTA